MSDLKKPAQPAGAVDPIVSRLVEEDEVSWLHKPNLRYLYCILFVSCMGVEITSGFDSQLINALQMIPRWNSYFGHPQGSLKGIISASYSLGAILSLPLVPIVNDHLGRRWSIMLGSILQIIGSIIQCCSQNTGMYIFARMVLGFGVPTCIVAASSLIAETAYPKERPVLTSLFNASFFIGSIIASAVCCGTNNIPSDWSWRLPSILQACPSFLQVGFIFCCPESPRWLITQDRCVEANEILIHYHGEDDWDSEFVRAEMAQVRATIELEMQNSRKSWRDMIATKGMRKRVLLATVLGLFTQWCGSSLIAYYLSDLLHAIGVTDSMVKQKINLGKSCWSGICSFIAAMIVTKFKRRPMYLTCTISLLVCYICWTVSTERATTAIVAGVQNNAAVIATIFFIFAYAPCYTIGFNALTYTYLVELFPFATRSRGISIFQLFGRLAGFFTIFVNPIGLLHIGWKYLISYCCWIAFEIGFIYFMFPETFGKTLEELAFLFEDKALADQVSQSTKKFVEADSEKCFDDRMKKEKA